MTERAVDKPPHFEVLTRLLLPALSLVAFVLAQLRGEQVLKWPLLGLVILFVALGFAPSLNSKIQDQVLLRRQAALARRLFPELRILTNQFWKFIDSGSSETLFDILQRAQPSSTMDVRLPSRDLIYYPWHHLNHRLQSQHGTKTEFLDSLQELDSVVRAFDLNYVLPVFERMPETLQKTLPSSTRRDLAVFRERFVHYLDACVALRDKVQPLLPQPSPIFAFPMPRPLP